MSQSPETPEQEKAAGHVLTTKAAQDFLQTDYTKLAQRLAPIAETQIFVAWKPGPVDPETGKFPKWPINAGGGKLEGWQKVENHLTLEAAIARAWANEKLRAGVGVAFTGEPVATDAAERPLFLVALDLDNVVADAVLAPHAEEIVALVGSYAEISPSGKGVRILAFTRDALKSKKLPKLLIDGVEVGREVFASSGFVTLTGNAINCQPVRVVTKKLGLVAERWGAERAKKAAPAGPDPKASMSEAERQQVVAKLESAVPYLDTESYDDFVSVMKAFACVAPGIGEDEAIRLAEMAANNAPEICQANNGMDGTSPAAMVARPGTGTVDQGVGRVMTRARKTAIRKAIIAVGKPRFGKEVVAAFRFLERHNPNVAAAIAFIAREAM